MLNFFIGLMVGIPVGVILLTIFCIMYNSGHSDQK